MPNTFLKGNSKSTIQPTDWKIKAFIPFPKLLICK